MASGRKNYFRHNNQAGNDESLMHLIEEFGIISYAWWFLLLELCNEQYVNSDTKLDGKFKFHERNVTRKLHISLTKLKVFLGFCEGLSLLSFNFAEHSLNLDIPNTLKYFGSYDLSSTHVASKETKLNKTKLNKTKLNKDSQKNEHEKNITSSENTKLEKPNGFCHESFKQSKFSFELIESKNVSKELQNAWVEKYPLDFILSEFEKISFWIMANPQNKKKNYGAFINNWLSRGHESIKNAFTNNFNNHMTKAEIIQQKLINMKNPYAEK